MNTCLLITASINVLALAYVMLFTESTLILGLELSDTKFGNGFQDAITPPTFSKYQAMAMAGPFAIVAVFGWQNGFLSAVGLFVAMFMGVMISKRFMPGPESMHFRTLVVQSMARRYADFVKTGDAMRVDAMGELLRKMGVDLGVKKPLDVVKAPSKEETGIALIQEYGLAIEAHAATQSDVADVSKLPAPKETLRAAIVSEIRAADNPDIRS
jgi:hypothetical protein